MPRSTFEKFLPASGVLAGILFGVSGFLQQVPQENSKVDALALLTDHRLVNSISAVAGGLFLVVMAFFAAGLRQALRSGEPGESSYSSVAYAGGLMMAITFGLTAWVTLGMTDAAQNKDAASAQVLGTLGAAGWLPLVASMCVLYLATGLGGLRTAALPRWLSIVTTIMGVACLLGPLGIAVYFLTPLWMIAASVVLLGRARETAAAPREAAAVPA
jgi:hypothetical protein